MRDITAGYFETVCLTIFSIAGDALLFFDMDVAGEKMDRHALHASCPTLKVTVT